MHNKKQTPLALALYGIGLLALLFLTMGAGNIPTAWAQKAAATQPVAGAVVTLHTIKTSFGASDSVLLSMTITNPHNFSIRLLKRSTPLDGVEKPLFTVTRDGAPVAYLGKIIKFAAPTEQDYVTLKAGESLTRNVDLSAYYDLSISGNYSVIYHTASAEMYAEINSKDLVRHAGSLVSNTTELFITAHAAHPVKKIARTVVTGTNSFNSCSVSQQTDLINARIAASTYENNAVAYFSANKHGARYTTWFGIFDTGRYNTVSSHFSALHNAIDTANPMAFDCTCTDDYYAYVYPDSPYEIYLCQVFWSAPLTGTDSKAGTLIHETSHFTVVAGTDDNAYGQDAAKALAISNPALAIANADSHEYFSENSPPLEPDVTATKTRTPTKTLTPTITRTPTITPTPTKTAIPTIVTLNSMPGQDGWVIESSETSEAGGAINSTGLINIGDNTAKSQYRSILSFNTGSLPDMAVITGLTLKLKQQGIVGTGDPLTIFQGFMFDIKNGFFGTIPALETTDFQAAANGTYGPSTNPPFVGNVYSFNLSNGKANVNTLATNGGLTQIRLRFKLDDNNDAAANYLSFYGGEAALATDRPQLVVTYYVP